MDLCLCCPLAACRYTVCLPDGDPPDVMFFGDSALDFYSHTDGLPCLTRPQWTAFSAELAQSVGEGGLVVQNYSCSGAPGYALCCLSPFMLRCRTPQKAMVVSMGGNEFIWLPCPLLHLAMAWMGSTASPVCSFSMFMNQVEYWAGAIPVVFIPDYGVIDGCPTGYDSYVRELQALAGQVITPIADYSDTGTISFTYEHTENSSARHPGLVVLNTVPVFQEMQQNHPELYETMFSQLEQTEASYQLWNTWLLYTLKLQLVEDIALEVPQAQSDVDLLLEAPGNAEEGFCCA